MDKEMERLLAQLEQLKREYRSLFRNQSPLFKDDPKNIEQVNFQIEKLKEVLQSSKREAAGLSSVFDNLNTQLKANLAELDKSNTSLGMGKRAYRDIVNTVRQLADEESGIDRLSFQQLKKLKSRNSSALKEVKLAGERLAFEKGIRNQSDIARANLTENEEALARAYLDGFEGEKKAARFVEYRLDLERRVLDTTKLTGGVLNGIGNLASSLGLSGFAESLEEIKGGLDDDLRKSIREAAVAQFKEVNPEYKKSLDQIEESSAAIAELQDSISKGLRPTKAQKEFLKQQEEKLKNAQKFVEDSEEGVQALYDQSKATNTLNAKLKAVLKSGKAFLKQLSDPAVLVGSMVKGFLAIDEAATNFQRTTGQNAKVLAGQNFALVTSAETLELMSSFAEETNLNLNNLVSSRQLGNIAEAAKLMGITQKDAAKLAMNMQLSGTSTDEFTDQAFEGAKAIVESGASGLNLGNVLQEASKASGAIALSLGNNPTALARATAEAQRLGLSLERMDDIAGSMLDFESSIQAELEAQLLTGKNINLAKAREFALNNNLEGLSREIRENNALSNDFGKANRITQEAMAKAMGMSRDELAKMVVLNKLQDGISADVVANQMNMRKEQVLQMSAQDKFNTAVGKLQQALGPILDLFVTILTPISQLATGIGYVFSQFGKLGALIKDTADKYIRPFFGSFNDGLEDAGDGIGFLEAVGKKLGALYLFKMLTGLPDKIKKMVEGIKSFFSTIGLGSKVTKEVGEQAAESTAKAGASATTKVAGKVGAKGLAKMGGKFASKLLPGVGLGFAAADFAEGDYIGAVLNSIGGLASFIPGIGTTAAAITSGATTGIDIARDMGYLPFAKGGVVTQPVKGIVGEAGPEAVVPLSKLPEMMGGGLSLEGLNVKFDEMINKLDELTNIKGDVYIDGNKTGQAIFSAATNLS